MKIIDLNCDMGEGAGNDQAIIPFINSANIACGFHAGNREIIEQTILLSKKYGVNIGAHPSFRDKENFGRKEQFLPEDKLYAIVLEQLIKMDLIAREKGASLHHVKPHGALYNMGARNPKIAWIIAQAVADFNADLELYGLSGSHLITEAKRLGLKTKNEVFADRTYMDDGSLTPRTVPGALIETGEACLRQVLQMVESGTVTTINGSVIPVEADTICIHGDGSHAVEFACKIHIALQQQDLVSQTL